MKWEYRIEQLNLTMHGVGSTEDTTKSLNGLGQQGWEAVSVWYEDSGFGIYALFKRAL
jgi:hypothetical protein